MRRRSLLIGALLLAGALTGCIGDTGESGDEIEQASVDEAAKQAGEIDTEALEGMIQAAIATPAISFNSGGTFAFTLDRPDNATGYVLELTWDAATPASEELDLWVRLEGTGTIPPSDPTSPAPEDPIATATGSSPLTLTLTPEDFPDDESYEMIVRAPTPAGVAVNQAFELHVSTFIETAFDPDHSALE